MNTTSVVAKTLLDKIVIFFFVGLFTIVVTFVFIFILCIYLYSYEFIVICLGYFFISRVGCVL